MRIVLTLSSFFLTLAQAQDVQRNRLTFDGGEAFSIRGACCGTNTEPSLGGTYGFRLTKYVELESGVLTAIHPSSIDDTRFPAPNDHFTWVHFGPRFILPVHTRFEVSLGIGGVFEDYRIRENTAIGRFNRSGFGGSLSAGAHVAIDSKRHWWLGVTPRVIRVPTKDVKDAWFVATGNLSYRF